MEAFQNQLKDMTKTVENTRNNKIISEIDLLTIKCTYRKLAKLIHPNINPLTSEIPENC
jgi:hypothetical protein